MWQKGKYQWLASVEFPQDSKSEKQFSFLMRGDWWGDGGRLGALDNKCTVYQSRQPKPGWGNSQTVHHLMV